jgi:predicted RND superfamily exporter protein
MLARFVERILTRIVELQAKRPWLFVIVGVLTIAPALHLALKLQVRTGFGELLPERQPSVIELKRASGRLPSMSTLAVTAESKDTALLKRFMDELTPQLQRLPMVSDVETGPRDVQDFFSRHKYVYADLADIEALHEDVISRYDWEVGKKLGTNVDDDEPPPVTAESVRRRFQKSLDELKKNTRGVDGYYIGEDGTFAVILVRTPLGSMDQRAFDLQERISALVAEGPWKKLDPQFRVGFTGNLVTSAEEYRDVTRDLTQTGAVGVALVLAVVFFFFWRVRVLIALAIAIGLGSLWCFAFAQVAIGHLNTASGFLVSVVVGNGINAMIIYMARFMEARRLEKLDTAQALRTATLTTCGATFAAVGVAMVSYGALMTTEFRGFRHFGIIGAAGMFLCWLSTYTVLPSILVISDRFKPFPTDRWTDDLSGAYGRPVIWLAKRFARPVAIVGVVSGVLAVIASVVYFAGDPMEYDLNKIRNVQTSEVTSAGALSARMSKVVARVNQSGRAVLVDRLDQVQPLVATLEAVRDAAPAGQKPFSDVVSIYSLLPKDQDKKLVLVREILDRVTRARDKGFISEQEWQELEPHLPEEVRPVGIADLPKKVARPFEERDGTRGTVVYVAPARGRSINDARYLMVWADSFREIKLPNGEKILASGDAVVFSDMLRVIARDSPRVALLSFIGTVIVILLSFRGSAGGFVALSALLLGVSWMIGVLFLGGVKLNFLNFVALPIAIGVGSDYAINVMKRREIEGDAGIERAFTETGGAVVACSMTTLCGYIALFFSVNGAVRSLGLTAGLGEVATQLSAMLVLPAALYSFAARRNRQKAASGSSATPPPSDVRENV